MPKENQSDGRAHDCDHEQIFCAHGHIHAHRKSRVIGVLMAMCTSKPIIGKDASRADTGKGSIEICTNTNAFYHIWKPKINDQMLKIVNPALSRWQILVGTTQEGLQ